jgi:biopolymer transport protein TolR
MGAALTQPGRSRKLPEPEINITPLVDVVLVLLIIFMVIGPSLEHGERVELPSILRPDKVQKKDPITVTVGAGGKLFYEKEAVDDAALKEKLRALHDEQPDKRVVLKGDSAVGYARIRDVFAMAQDTGHTAIALVASKRKGSADEESTEEE